MNLKLIRYHRTPSVTIGKLIAEDDTFKCATIERPWKDNQKTISCIPTGLYTVELGMYYGGDGVGGKQDYPAYELRNVPNRTEIKIHIGNYVRNVIGCIALGLKPDLAFPAVWSSQRAYQMFMQFMFGVDSFSLEVRNAYKEVKYD